ncbi:MAG: ribose 5-phosphate isomerase B [Bacteroidota bacterium]
MEDFDIVVGIGCDHAGYELKEKLKSKLKKFGYTVQDFGANSKLSVDYPDIIHPLAKAVNDGKIHKAIIICGSGNGVAMVANKYINVRAAVCWSPEIAKYARLHNDANIISIPARFVSQRKAFTIMDVFMTTAFEAGRHKIRVEKISAVIV